MRLTSLACVALVLVAAAAAPGCAHRATARAEIGALADQYHLTRAQVRRFRAGLEVAQAAATFLGRSELSADGVSFRYDCSGLVNAAYHGAGLDLEGANSEALFRRSRSEHVYHRRRAPLPGDIAFFDNTHDRNGNRRLDDRLTHVGIVERVDDDGTIILIHKGGSGVSRIVMNLRHRRQQVDEAGEPINSYLRGRTPRDRKRTRYLAGELWRGFGSLWRAD
jgi:hypothetical protein